MIIFKTIKSCISNGVYISLQRNIEEVYFIRYGKDTVENTFDLEEAEYLYELTKDGYDFESKFSIDLDN